MQCQNSGKKHDNKNVQPPFHKIPSLKVNIHTSEDQKHSIQY